MSTELSRVSTHKRRKQEEKQKRPSKKLELVTGRKRSDRGRAPAQEAGQASMERASRTQRKRLKEPVKRDQIEKGTVPTRSETYASKKIKISKYFVNTLIILFMLLTAFLVWWGVKDAPPLEELW